MSQAVTSEYFHISPQSYQHKIQPDNSVQKYLLWLKTDASPILKIASVALPIITTIALGAWVGFPGLALSIIYFPIVLIGLSNVGALLTKRHKAYTEELLIRAVGGEEEFKKLPIHRFEGKLNSNKFCELAKDSSYFNFATSSTNPITKIIDKSGQTNLWLKIFRKEPRQPIDLWIYYDVNPQEGYLDQWRCARREEDKLRQGPIFKYPVPFAIKDLIEGVDQNFELIPSPSK